MSRQKNEKCVWTTVMEDALVEAYVHQHNLGNRQGGTFTSKALDEILQEMRDRFPDKVFDKTKIKDHMKKLKSKFTPLYDLFKHGLSGFGWDPISNMWTAEPEVWEKLIEAKPEAAMWRNKPMPHYEKLVILYGQDRATGEYAETASEMRQRGATSSKTNFDSIHDIDEMLSNNEASLHNFDANNDEHVQISPEAQYEANPESSNQEGMSYKKRKGKNRDVDPGLEMIANTMNSMVDALVKSSAEFSKNQSTRVMSENEVYAMLEEMQVDESIFDKAYFFLIRNTDAQRALMGYPPQRRMRMLTYLLSTDNVAP